MKYDSTYGKLTNKVKSIKTGLEIDGSFIEVTHKSSIDEVDWAKNNVDIVIDSSGVVENIKKARNLQEIIPNVSDLMVSTKQDIKDLAMETMYEICKTSGNKDIDASEEIWRFFKKYL